MKVDSSESELLISKLLTVQAKKVDVLYKGVLHWTVTANPHLVKRHLTFSKAAFFFRGVVIDNLSTWTKNRVSHVI